MTWFIHHDEKILGPFTTEKILHDLKAGDLSYGAFIWSKGQVEWVPVSEWENNLESILAHSDQSKGRWKLRTPKKMLTDLSFDEVLQLLKVMESFKLVAVSPDNEEKWVPIYSSYVFMEALNLSRRNFLRAPLMGLSKITKDGSRFSYVVKTATIGQGGIGVYGLGPNFEPGMEVGLKVESEDLDTSINVVGTIVYNTDQGFVGIRFGKIPEESTAIIIQYMKRFHSDTPTEDAGKGENEDNGKKAS